METRTLCSFVFLIVILFGAVFLRNQGAPNIPAGQLTVPDGYFYYWQAHLISEHGQLPGQDMRRWVPLKFRESVFKI